MLGEENYPHCHSLQRKTIDSFPLLFRSRMNPWPADLPQVPMDGGGCGSGGQPVVEPRPLPSESHCGRPQASSMAGLRRGSPVRIGARGMVSRCWRGLGQGGWQAAATASTSVGRGRPGKSRCVGAWVNPSVSPLPRARSAGL